MDTPGTVATARNEKNRGRDKNVNLPEIDRIEAEALVKGWPKERLWSADFWRLPRGLAAVLDPEDQVIEVRVEWISIRKADGNLQRFYRFDG